MDNRKILGRISIKLKKLIKAELLQSKIDNAYILRVDRKQIDTLFTLENAVSFVSLLAQEKETPTPKYKDKDKVLIETGNDFIKFTQGDIKGEPVLSVDGCFYYCVISLGRNGIYREDKILRWSN